MTICKQSVRLRKARKFFRNNRQMYLLLCFLPLHLAFFLSQLLDLPYTVIHTALDDAIPFLPVFVLPYVAWYAYITLPLIYFCFRDKAMFFRLCRVLLPGMCIGNLLFLVAPTAIDFRPEAEGNGIFLALCRLIYANDNPVNVCPSLHCFEAAAIHLSVFHGSAYGTRKGLRWASGILVVLICLSTMFIKQHSVVDVVYGILLAVLLYGIVIALEKRRKSGA